MTKKSLVMPGDQVSTSEELIPGPGTFEEDGIIRAAIMGSYRVDNKERKAIVEPVTSVPVTVKKGDTVLAEVRSARSTMIIADVFHVSGNKRGVSGDTNGTIHASEISRAYIKDASTEFKAGDILRAQVIQVKPSIQLATKDRHLGVIKALCSKCRHPLHQKGNTLECDYCGNKERRTTAQDYGSFDINKL